MHFYEKPTTMDFDRVRSEYSILIIMAKLGCDMTHKGYMCKAPFREDRNPSMHIDERRKMWCDYGTILPDGRRAGGGNIELVRLMFGLNSNKEEADKIIDICAVEESILTLQASGVMKLISG